MEEIYKVKFDTEYFTLYEVREGLYAAIEKGNNTGSNAGIIDLGGITIIFDTFLNIDAARELKNASEQLTGKSADYVINSHSHTDHFIGNCLFSESTKIMSSIPVSDTIKAAKEEFALEKSQYFGRVKEIEESIASGKNKENISDMNNELQFLKNLIKPGVEIRIPDQVIDKKLILQGSKRSVHLIPFDIAHSKGDTIAYLPEDKVCFTGDLLFNKSHVWLGAGNPDKFIDVLEDLLKYNIVDFVPGHGQLATITDVLAQIQYINEIMHLVKKKKSSNIQDYSINELSQMFWQWKSLCFTWNINFLIERLKESMQEVHKQ